MAKGLEGRCSILLSGEPSMLGVVWQQKYLYIRNTRRRGLWLEAFFFLAWFFLFVLGGKG